VGTSGNNGQGFSYGRGSWQPIAGNGVALRPLAVAVKATGYYRPEDIDIDAKALAAMSASAGTTQDVTPRATSAR
jgi:hypothetical protein